MVTDDAAEGIFHTVVSCVFSQSEMRHAIQYFTPEISLAVCLRGGVCWILSTGSSLSTSQLAPHVKYCNSIGIGTMYDTRTSPVARQTSQWTFRHTVLQY